MKKSTKKTKNTVKIMTGIGAGLAAAGAAAAAGYYFYGSTSAKKHRKIAVAWANDMKKEVVQEAKRLKKARPEEISAIIDRVAKVYQAARSATPAEVKRAAAELKANWDMVQRETGHTVRKSVSRAKKTIAKRTK